MKLVADFFRRLKIVLGEIFHDFLRPSRSLPRFLDELETLASVLLAIAFAHLLGAQNVGWAAFSGYMVMRSELRETLTRGGLRIVGTLAGAGAACLLAGKVGQSELWVSLSVALVGAVTLYCAITRAHSYAWLFTGLTFSMVALDALQQPAIGVFAFAATRILEVVAGTSACLIVSTLSALTVRSHWVMTPAKKPEVKSASADGTSTTTYNPAAPMLSADPVPNESSADVAAAVPQPPTPRMAIPHVLQAGVALALTPFLGHWMEIEYFSQAAITIIAVMMVPLSALTPRSKTVHTKNIHRLLGCSVGAVMAGVLVLLFGANWIAMTLGMSLGVLIGRHIENSGRSFAYVGTQFALVYLVLTVPDSYSTISVASGIERLGGIVAGVVLIELVRLLSLPWWRKAVAS